MRWPSGHRGYPKTYALLENWGESYSACTPQARGGGDATPFLFFLRLGSSSATSPETS